MREGLGKKYGEPRRTGQEGIRSEIAWSDAAEAAINRKLDELQALSRCVAGAAVTTPPADSDDAALAAASLNVRVQVW
jgi:hypothetical protein